MDEAKDLDIVSAISMASRGDAGHKPLTRPVQVS